MEAACCSVGTTVSVPVSVITRDRHYEGSALIKTSKKIKKIMYSTPFN